MTEAGTGPGLRDDLADALAAWELEPVTAVQRAAGGTMNETFVVTTRTRRVVLRRHRRTDRSLIEREHAVIRYAIGRSIPTPPALPTPAGEVIVSRDGVCYSLFAYARGTQVARDRLTVAEARAMGRTLAHLHLALADCPAAAPPRPPTPADRSRTEARLTELLNLIMARPDRTETDRWAEQHVRTKLDWLSGHPEPARHAVPMAAQQLVHGDFQESNLFFIGDEVSDVIDWDKAETRWPPEEIIRTLDLSFDLRPDLCAALLAGYRTVRDVAPDELDRAAANYSHDQLHGHWLFDEIYRRGNDRVRAFLEPGPYLPFTDRWVELGWTLDGEPC
ncbi:phosphotransferase [Microlunatus parietis]|uniref:Ser/Thr protein kinase RdoA (MazF antagonist) n=1 Tax=Microlunatus parietis TaxID=682979 RepID=A0A7Y9I8G2_9ACTN|nr:phosphotransferase [Microlunatus parietis]NYE72266.1 Ser/Thr protein kinase RdoA (MazF antagonist) [Microlunatus parietis]